MSNKLSDTKAETPSSKSIIMMKQIANDKQNE